MTEQLYEDGVWFISTILLEIVTTEDQPLIRVGLDWGRVWQLVARMECFNYNKRNELKNFAMEIIPEVIAKVTKEKICIVFK